MPQGKTKQRTKKDNVDQTVMYVGQKKKKQLLSFKLNMYAFQKLHFA